MDRAEAAVDRRARFGPEIGPDLGAALARLELGLGEGALAEGEIGIEPRRDQEGFGIGILVAIGGDRLPCTVAQAFARKSQQPVLVHREIAHPIGALVEHTGYDHRHIGRNRGRVGRPGVAGQGDAIDHRGKGLRRLAPRAIGGFELGLRFQQRRPRHVLQLAHIARRDVERVEQAFRGGAGHFGRHHPQRGTAHHPGAVEQALASGHRHQHAGLRAAAGLAVDQHPLAIAAEGRDILAHPGERRDDVLHADRARGREILSAEFGEMQEAEGAEAVVDRDHDAVGKPRHLFAVHAHRIARSAVESAAMEHHDHRLLGIRFKAGRPDIEREIVFAHAGRIAIDHDQVGIDMAPIARNLRRDIGPVERVADPGPGFHGARRHEAVRARSIGGIADPAKDGDVAGGQPAQFALRGLDHREHALRQDRPGRHGRADGKRRSQCLSACHHRLSPSLSRLTIEPIAGQC